MTEAEYVANLKGWAAAAASEMRGKISSHTHGSGALAKSVRYRVAEMKKYGTHFIGFSFHKLGVFLQYGVGRGWIRFQGNVIRGKRISSNGKPTKGYLPLEDNGGKGRPAPLDWFDSTILAHAESLADISAEYWGDLTTNKVLNMVKRMTILKEPDDDDDD